MNRHELVQAVRTALDGRQLVWFGTRAEDATSLSDIPEFEWSFSLQGESRSRLSMDSVSLETITGQRVDLDSYDIDDHLLSPEVAEFRTALLRVLARPSAIIPYRPTTFLSSIGFSRSDRCRVLGMFRGHQMAFEHKPWMETSVAATGIPRIEWRYVADSDQFEASSMLSDGPVMLRQSRSTGGVGLTKIESPDELPVRRSYLEEAFLSVAPFVDGGLPVNIGAVVWDDGVTLHPGSVQLVGIPGCTSRPFGFCGNDFARFTELGPEIITAVEHSTRAVADVLRFLGFRGAFGIDYLVKDGVPLFMEVNPRFQGSTHLSCRIAREADQSCLLLDHLAALLGLPAPAPVALIDVCSWAGRLAHVVVHSTQPAPARIDPSPLIERLHRVEGLLDIDLAVSPALVCEPSGVILRTTMAGPVTTDGFSLDGAWGAVMRSATATCIVESELAAAAGSRKHAGNAPAGA
jgi:formate-dependent phosphoribosylglycinamide formyltransferase (GAR transformylase)